MEWYRKIAFPLDPQAWEADPHPHRLLRHMDYVWQRQDPEELRRTYQGVHLTESPGLAGMYASGKASEGDPPVIIEVDTAEEERHPDIDVQEDYALDAYLDDKRQEWEEFLDSGESAEAIASAFVDSLQDDATFFEEEDAPETVSDVVSRNARSIPPTAIENYLSGKTDDEIADVVRRLVSGNAPPEIQVSVLNQFRLLNPVGDDRVRAIYQVPLMAMDARADSYDYMDEERLEREGLAQDAEGNVYDEDGRLLLGYDDLENDPPFRMTPLYQNPSVPEGRTAWHGTTLSRAKQAFPGLL